MTPEELSHKLRKDAISKGHSVQTVASGYSMFPFLRKGDLLTVEPVPMDKIKRGDVIVFESNGKWIAHRVMIKFIENDKIKLIPRGDARISSDPIVTFENYVGIVSIYQRRNNIISLSSRGSLIRTNCHLIGGTPLAFLINFFIRIRFER